MKSTVITTERKFRYELDETEAHVLYAMLNMSDEKLEEWITQQSVYEDWTTDAGAVETAKGIRDKIQDGVLK